LNEFIIKTKIVIEKRKNKVDLTSPFLSPIEVIVEMINNDPERKIEK